MQANREKAKLLTQQRRYEEAEEVRKWIWQKCQKKFGEDACFLQVALESLTEFCQFGSGFIAVEAQEDRMTIEAQHEFASTLQLQEKFQDAEREQRDVLEKAKRFLTEDLWETPG